MKPISHSHFFGFLTNNHIRKCESTLTKSASRCSLVWQSVHGLVRTKMFNLKQTFAVSGIRIIQDVYQHLRLRLYRLTKRHIVGIVMLGAGAALCFPGLFFNPLDYDHAPCRVFGLTAQCYSFETKSGWCFMSWYIYLENLGVYLATIFWCIAGFLCIPKKFSGISFSIFSILGAFAWTKVLHVTFFARSTETFRAFPEWEIIFSGAVLAIIGLAATNQAMTYWEHHKRRGNWQRFVGVTEMDIPFKEKEPMYKELAKQYRDIQKMI